MMINLPSQYFWVIPPRGLPNNVSDSYVFPTFHFLKDENFNLSGYGVWVPKYLPANCKALKFCHDSL